MEVIMTHGQQEKTDVVVRLDAVKIAADEFRKEGFRGLGGYNLNYDYRLPGGTEERMYDRVRQYVNKKTGAKIGVAYDPSHSWMPPCIVTLTPDDQAGMRRSELEEVLAVLPNFRFLKIELAHDFRADSIVNARFARKHLIVGKSHRRKSGANAPILHFGARRSPVFARSYWKKTIDSYRIEIEYHREWLAKHAIKTTNDFLKLPELTARRYIAFYKIDPLKLSAALARLGVPVAPTLKKVVARENDLHAALHYLRHDVGLVNTLRILTPLTTNGRVVRALQQWARDWEKQGQSADKVA
jgi:hypothetical protein